MMSISVMEGNVSVDDVTTSLGSGKNFHVKSHDDATWILSSAFVVFTMQSGFGLLESGSVSSKNEVNIMVKNAVDVICGGLTYWMFGYGLSFGEDQRYMNSFSGWGDFFVNADEDSLGYVYSKFFFQASFATTATTIVSGAMAERTKLEAYIVFSLLNTFVYCFPAHWFWGKTGWLHNLGVIDIAGAGPVHVVGGVTGLVSTILLKPRHNRFQMKTAPQMGSPTNAMLGMFMLWWGWLGFNCGSTFGISGLKWKLAARSAVATICASTAGGIVGLTLSYTLKKRQFDVGYLINSILGSLVGITATCAMAHPWEGLLIGVVGACLTILANSLLERFKVDDPVGCVGVHAVGGMWSLLAAGLVARKDTFANELHLTKVRNGLFSGGGFHQLGVQALAIVVLIGWTVVTSFIFLKVIDLVIGLRVPLAEELLGADLIEHGIGRGVYDKTSKTVRYNDGDDTDVLKYVTWQPSHSIGKHTDVPARKEFSPISPGNELSKRRVFKHMYSLVKFGLKKKNNGRKGGHKKLDRNDNMFRPVDTDCEGFVYEDFGRFEHNYSNQYSYQYSTTPTRDLYNPKQTADEVVFTYGCDKNVHSNMQEKTYI